jgi:hypothetical protein
VCRSYWEHDAVDELVNGRQPSRRMVAAEAGSRGNAQMQMCADKLTRVDHWARMIC